MTLRMRLMQFFISLMVLIATFIQMLCSVVDLREARTEAARWIGAEDALVHESPLLRRGRVRRELRSWRDPDIHRGILYINTVLASWVILFAAAGIAFVTAPLPWA